MTTEKWPAGSSAGAEKRTRSWPSVLAIATIAVATLLPRAAFVARKANSWKLATHNDEYRHLQYADNLWNSGTFGRKVGVADCEQPPVYPMALAPFVGWFGFRPVAFLWLQVAMCTVSAVLAFILARRVHSCPAGWIAAAMYATYLPTVSRPTYFVNETLSVLLMFGCLLLSSRLIKGACRLTTAGAAGVLFALLALTRFATFPLILVTAVIVIVTGKYQRPAIATAFILVAAFTAAYSPWIVRNYIQFNDIIVLSPKGETTAAFSQLCAMYIDGGDGLGEAREKAKEVVAARIREDRLDELKTSRLSLQYARHCWQRLRILFGAHPVLGLPFPFSGSHYGNSVYSNWANYLWTFVMLLGVLIAAVIAFHRHNVHLAHVVLVPLALICLYSLVHVIPRYQIVSFAAWSVPAGVGWASVVAGITSSPGSSNPALQSRAVQ